MSGRPRTVNRKAKRSTPDDCSSRIALLFKDESVGLRSWSASKPSPREGRDRESSAPAWSRVSHRFADIIRQNDEKNDVDAIPRRQPLSGAPGHRGTSRGVVTKPRIRQRDIAREADVSVATVDRVLNSRPGVNIHTARRIRDAVARLENRRDQAASRRPPFLRFDFILPGGTNTFMSMLEAAITSAGQAYAAAGVTLRCHRIEGFNPHVLAQSIPEIGAHSGGLAVVALENPMVREAVNDVTDLGVPVVTLVSNLSTPRTAGYVGLDNRAAGRTAARARFVRRGTQCRNQRSPPDRAA